MGRGRLEAIPVTPASPLTYGDRVYFKCTSLSVGNDGLQPPGTLGRRIAAVRIDVFLESILGEPSTDVAREGPLPDSEPHGLAYSLYVRRRR